jgi:hypothetical protein
MASAVDLHDQNLSPVSSEFLVRRGARLALPKNLSDAHWRGRTRTHRHRFELSDRREGCLARSPYRAQAAREDKLSRALPPSTCAPPVEVEVNQAIWVAADVGKLGHGWPPREFEATVFSARKMIIWLSGT